MATHTISLGRIQTTLPKKLYFGSETPERPGGTKLITVNADPSNSQHFYFCTREDEKEGVLATYDLSYILTKQVNSDVHYQESPRPPLVNGAEYPSWVKEDMMFILEASGQREYIFRWKNDLKMVLSCIRDEVGAPIIIMEESTGDPRKHRFTLQNIPPS